MNTRRIGDKALVKAGLSASQWLVAGLSAAGLAGVVLASGCESAQEAPAAGPADSAKVSALGKDELTAFCKTQMAAFAGWPAEPSCATPTDASGAPIVGDFNLQPTKPTAEMCVANPPNCPVGVVKKCWEAAAKDPCALSNPSGACAELVDCARADADKASLWDYGCVNEKANVWTCKSNWSLHNVNASARIEIEPGKGSWQIILTRHNDAPWWDDWGQWGKSKIGFESKYPNQLGSEAELIVHREAGGQTNWNAGFAMSNIEALNIHVYGFDGWTLFAAWYREFDRIGIMFKGTELEGKGGKIYVDYHYKPY